MSDLKSRCRNLRVNQTPTEGLLWSLLRARQLCGLKFRRQHSIGPWIVDFACVQRQLIVEIDGEYHDAVQEKDLGRQADLQDRGWTVIRFTVDEVEKDAETVARAIAAHPGLDFKFSRRRGTGSGMRSAKVKGNNPNR